jgi:molecular chaperone DnaK
MDDLIVGIDLGTTNSLVALCDERGPRVLGGDALLPSVVRYEADGSVVVGRDARDRAVDFPLATVTSVKRLMGRSRTDIEPDLGFLSYEVVEGEHNTARVAVPIGGERLVVSPQEVSARILRSLADRAREELGREVRKAVVTVPAYFDDAQRQATRDAGRIAGLEVVRIVNEPTAAALAYGIGLDRSASRNASPQNVVVYDLGGGTFDVSVLRMTPGDPAGKKAGGGEEPRAPSFYEVLSTAGDTHLGGDDIDHALVRLFITEIAEQMGVELTSLEQFPPATRRALKGFAEQVKHRLSEEQEAQVRIQVNADRFYERAISRDELESIASPWVERTVECCKRALRDANRSLAGQAIDAVILVGGSTRIPLVRRRVSEFFGLEPYTAVDPDRVVALGAAVQASILSGIETGSLLLDVIPLSLGIETVGGAMAKLILRNSTVPARAVERFSTSVDGQTSVKLNVLQGEREMVEDCRSLGEFHLRGLPPMPAGIPQLEVEFLVDANGVLNVAAVERRSGKRASLQVVPNHGLTPDEVDRMEADSYEFALEDMTRHRVVDLITNSTLDLKWIGERLERHAGRLDDAYRDALGAKIDALRALVEAAQEDWRSVDPDAFYHAKDDLDRASVHLQEVGIAESLKDE